MAEDAAAAIAAFIEKRKARYTAQALEVFETKLEATLKRRGLLDDPEIQAGVNEAKAIVRAKIRDLAADATETMTLTRIDFLTNDAASDLLSPDDKGVTTT